MNYAKYWKHGADKATRKHNAHIEKCNRVIEAGENGLPVGTAAEASELRQQLEGMRIEGLNLTSENKRLRHDLEQKSTMVADLSVRVDDAAKKAGIGNGPGNGARNGENSVQVATLVDRINRLEETLRTVRQENERLKGA
jgi:regulator of replication initiation timing